VELYQPRKTQVLDKKSDSVVLCHKSHTD